MLFDEPTLRKLHQLRLVAHQVRVGLLKGERRSTRRGSSIEFSDYRNYVAGDDLRRLDWNVYARTERPFVKLMEEEEDLTVHVLIDSSRSMAWPTMPGKDQNKLRFARRLAAALGAIALGTGDRFNLAIIQNGRISARIGPLRGGASLPRLLGFLEENRQGSFEAKGTTHLSSGLEAYGYTGGRAGLAFLISDLFSQENLQDILIHLAGRGYEIQVLHLLSPEEIDPPLAGDLQLIDSESGAGLDISVDGSLRDLYRSRLEKWREGLRDDCSRRNAKYLFLSTGEEWDRVVFYDMRRLGMVK
jgi:uncharacterized protein (DUF58 family)